MTVGQLCRIAVGSNRIGAATVDLLAGRVVKRPQDHDLATWEPALRDVPALKAVTSHEHG